MIRKRTSPGRHRARRGRIRDQGDETAARLQEAVRCQRDGALDTAEAIYRHVLRNDPNQPDALHLLGVVSLQNGDARTAITYIKQAIESRPDDAQFRLNLGNAYEACGECHRAILSLEHSLRLDPELTLAWINLAGLLRTAGHLKPASDCLKQALRLEQNNLSAWINLGALHQQQAEFAAACSCYQRVLQIDPLNREARVNLAAVQRAEGNPKRSIETLRELVHNGDGSVEVHYNLANALCDCGDFDSARRHYERVLEVSPRAARVIFNFATVTRFQEDSRPRLQSWETLASQPHMPDTDRVRLHFALGKAWNDLAEFDAAFQHYAKANRLIRTEFDSAEHQAWIDKTVRTFSPDFWADRQGWGLPTERPVFIIGMPRSGTTLVEQILATHSQIDAAGERGDVKRLVGESRRRHSDLCDSAVATEVSRAETESMAEEYVQAVFPETSQKLVTDKMPTNFLLLGWIALWFPRARVIHCRRDPRDVCLSCFFQHFTHQLPFTYDLKHLVAYYKGYERLMRHWRETLHLRMLEIQYEELVAQPEHVIRSIVSFCDLQWESNCLRFHQTARPVGTASQWQVRQPLYQTSRGRWQNFRRHLDVLVGAFGDQDCTTPG